MRRLPSTPLGGECGGYLLVLSTVLAAGRRTSCSDVVALIISYLLNIFPASVARNRETLVLRGLTKRGSTGTVF